MAGFALLNSGRTQAAAYRPLQREPLGDCRLRCGCRLSPAAAGGIIGGAGVMPVSFSRADGIRPTRCAGAGAVCRVKQDSFLLPLGAIIPLMLSLCP